MSHLFAHRARNSRKSFIREILKTTENADFISFAGGLPNPKLFPEKAIKKACIDVMTEEGAHALQYTISEGIPELREWISSRYARRGIDIKPDEILITNGAQQAIAIIGKTFIEKDDHIIIEKPGYVGAIQAFSFYEPIFHEVELQKDGINTEELWKTLESNDIHLMYAIPNFQNPTGSVYSGTKRKVVAALLKEREILLVEDEAYYDLRFEGRSLSPMRRHYDSNHILIGSFSKIIAPGLRIGWLCAKKPLMEKLIVAKQANDLHTNHLVQRILHRYLMDYSLDEQIFRITERYRRQCLFMIAAMKRYFPEEVTFETPEGGMFIWAKLPEGLSSEELLQLALIKKVAFVPGNAFCTDQSLDGFMRLNFTNSGEAKIEEGVKVLGEVIKEYMINFQPSTIADRGLKLTGVV